MECIYLTTEREGRAVWVRITRIRMREISFWEKIYPHDVKVPEIKALLELAKEYINWDDKLFFCFEKQNLKEKIEERFTGENGKLTCAGENDDIETLCRLLNRGKWKPVFTANGALSACIHEEIKLSSKRSVAMTEKEIARAIVEIDIEEPKYYRMYSTNPSAVVIRHRVNEILATGKGDDASDVIMAFMVYPAIKWSLNGKDINILMSTATNSECESSEQIGKLKRAQEIIRDAIGFKPALFLERRKKYFEAAQKLVDTIEKIIEEVAGCPACGYIYKEILVAFAGRDRKKISVYKINKYFEGVISLVQDTWGEELTTAIDGIMQPYIVEDESNAKNRVYHNIQMLLTEYCKILWKAKRSTDKAMRLLACKSEKEMLELTQSDDKLSQGYLIVEFAKIIYGAIETVKNFPVKGKIYYDILQELTNHSGMLATEKDMANKLGISSFAFSTKKREALDALATILWGYDGTMFYDMLTKPKA